MNEQPVPPTPQDEGRFDSTDAQLVIIEDTPEAHQVRKPPPWLLKLAQAERDKILKWGGSVDGTPPRNSADQS